jgi:uncharacterized protein YegP (UPF0339 family)
VNRKTNCGNLTVEEQKMADKYSIYKDAAGQYRWRYRAGNGKMIADSGEGYYNKADCINGINIMKASRDVPVEDTTVTQSIYGR